MALIKERRRHQRIDIGLPIEICYNKHRILAKTANISILGAYIETDKEIPIGTPLGIKVRIPRLRKTTTAKSRQVSCTGVVFRCQVTPFPGTYGIGIFFRAFSKDSEKVLANYIEHILLQEKQKGKIFVQKQKKRKGGKRK